MPSSVARHWWRLELVFHSELEETFIWKLQELVNTRFAFQFAPEDPAVRTLIVWLPDLDWPEDARDDLIDCLKPLAKTFGKTLSSPIWKKVADEDWSLSWKRQWKPDPVGSLLLILPAWLDVPKEYSHRLVLKLDPGSAFGTGSHPSTRLCLEALENNPPEGLSVVDLGCGSGILSLAALGFGAVEVLAVDNDSLAIQSTLENYRLNNLRKGSFRTELGSIGLLKSEFRNKKVDLLLCNILAPVIESFALHFEEIVATDGRALLSGLLVSQAPDLMLLFESLGWSVIAFTRMDRWGLIEICRAKMSEPNT